MSESDLAIIAAGVIGIAIGCLLVWLAHLIAEAARR